MPAFGNRQCRLTAQGCVRLGLPGRGKWVSFSAEEPAAKVVGSYFLLFEFNWFWFGRQELDGQRAVLRTLGLPLIHTRFQPGDQRPLKISEPFQRFSSSRHSRPYRLMKISYSCARLLLR